MNQSKQTLSTFLLKKRLKSSMHPHFYQDDTHQRQVVQLQRFCLDAMKYIYWVHTFQCFEIGRMRFSADKKINLAQKISSNSFSCAAKYTRLICTDNKDDLSTTFYRQFHFLCDRINAQSCNELPHMRWKYQTKPTRAQQDMEQTNYIVEILIFMTLTRY